MYKEVKMPDNLLNQFETITSIPPNDLHSKILTNLYKIFTSPLKKIPFIYIVPLSVCFALLCWFLLGKLLTPLVTLLQNGF